MKNDKELLEWIKTAIIELDKVKHIDYTGRIRELIKSREDK